LKYNIIFAYQLIRTAHPGGQQANRCINKMTTLKHSSNNCLATVTETTVYLSNLEGKIYKHFPIQHFHAEPFTTEVEFPADFETEKKAYNQRQANKQQERTESHNAWVAAQREIRKQEIINLWNWRKGRIEAYKIYTCDVPVETFGKNPGYYGSLSKLILGEETARNQFTETIGSWKPEFDNSPNNVQGEVALYHLDIELDERLEITSIDELNEIGIDWDPIEEESFSQKLPENCIIVETTSHRGNFNHTYYKPYALFLEGEFLGSYTIGYRKIENYSDLWGHEVFDNLFDYVEKYSSDENAIDLLKEKFNKEDAINIYGLSELQAEWIYEETEE